MNNDLELSVCVQQTTGDVIHVDSVNAKTDITKKKTLAITSLRQ